MATFTVLAKICSIKYFCNTKAAGLGKSKSTLAMLMYSWRKLAIGYDGCLFIPTSFITQMLQAAANITPRGVYVCGNTTTTSGLTVTLTKEGGGSGNYALEAGALVLADQGKKLP